MLNGHVPTSREHVFWGNVVTNVLRTIPLDKLLVSAGGWAGKPRERLDGTIVPLGREHKGAGDPARILVWPDDLVAISLSGVHELAVRPVGERSFARVPVGRGPLALETGIQPRTLVVANMFDDSLSIVDLDAQTATRNIRLTDSVRLTSEQRGEILFHDATLSLDGWFSCHSCHSNGHSIGQVNDNLGDESYGQPKRIPSLLGVAETAPWAWNGTQSSLAEQVRKSLFLTMHGAVRKEVREEDVFAIEDYLKLLPAAPGIDRARGRVNTPAINRGREVFVKAGCAECHVPPNFTMPDVAQPGLIGDPETLYLNPPSLRGVSQQMRWLHDARADNLRDVLERFNHQNGADLSPSDADDVLSFLRSI
jgi:hypothetical protein